MGCCEESEKGEIPQCLIKGANPSLLPKKMIDKLSETIVRIELLVESAKKKISTGFLMKINLQEKKNNFLLTCAHSISQQNIDSKMKIKIFYEKKNIKNEEAENEIELDINKRFIKSYKNIGFDTTIIEIIPEDNIPEDKYLYPDLNYKNGYEQYLGCQIFAGGFPNVDVFKGDKHFSLGEITKIGKKTFTHNCDTREGSSGSPLLNIDQKVIGIHFGCNKSETENYGIFIGAIIDLINIEEDKMIFKEKIDDKIKIDNSNIEKNIEKKTKEDKNDSLKEDEKQNQNKQFNDKEDDKKKDDEEDEKDITNNNKDNVLVNMLSEGEKNNKKFKPISQSDMALIGSIFNNPSLITLLKTLYKNPMMAEYLNNTPEIKRLKEKNPIFKEVLGNPELMEKLFTPELFNTFSQMYSMINKDEDKDKIKKNEDNEIKENNNDLMNQQIDMNNLINNINMNANDNQIKNNNNNDLSQLETIALLDGMNKGYEEALKKKAEEDRQTIERNLENLDESESDSVKYQDKIIQLKNLGFKNEKIIKQVLALYDGNLEDCINYLVTMEDP